MQEITAQEFHAKVLDVKGVVLVDFFAPWCRPCSMLMPVLEKIDRPIAFYKINIDNDPDLAASYHVRSIPTLLFFKDGALAETMVGVSQKEDIEACIDRLTSAS